MQKEIKKIAKSKKSKRAKKITKKELVEYIYKEISDVPRMTHTRIARIDINRIIDCFMNSVMKALQDDQMIELRRFGTFLVRTKKEYNARNPKTGETVKIETHGTTFFRPGRNLKKMVWSLRTLKEENKGDKNERGRTKTKATKDV